MSAALDADDVLRRAAAEVFEAVDAAVAGRGLPALAPWLLGSSPPSTRELARAATGAEQLALYGATVSAHEALASRFGEPAGVLGVSFGEIAALTSAGVWTVADGARVAHDLARVLTTCPGGLTLLSCDESTAAALVAHDDTAGVTVACVNDATETVVSGPVPELARVERRALRTGTTATRLRLPFSSHHPALERQAGRFAEAVRARLRASPRCPVYSAVAGGPYTAHDDLGARLSDCLTRPARLPAVLDRLVTDGFTSFYEAGPGTALTRSACRAMPFGRATFSSPLAAPRPRPGTARPENGEPTAPPLPPVAPVPPAESGPRS
ncbi:ACP S-malonyltransferase [Streptomyces hesseae]|uniref:[acyl-carrier-protein] S-malonyltransferase n=1 Tax=Streptomyces hesseae TaxID=3075519 RepID=A0ABU2SIV2_9ACTN|nr:acyltransferase domain-containing protein [Streptomyces sp. DSM 40473]MDT0447839.1 acyltransferase domain-containing protein [Streptomyces sp. DSM 40473]